jgi:hypothetical protein
MTSKFQPRSTLAAFGLLSLAAAVFLVASIKANHPFPMAEHLVVGGLVGGLLGALGGAIGAVFRSKGVASTSGRFGVVGAALAMTISGSVYKDISKALDPFDGLGERLAALPEFRQWAAAREGQEDIAAVVSRGLLRLDDNALDSRLRLMAALTTAAATRACADLERGTATRDDLAAMVRSLPGEQQRQYTEIAYQAAVAEIRQSPPRRWVSNHAQELFHEEMQRSLSQTPDGVKYLATLTDSSTASDQELCAASRAVYLAAASMTGEARKAASILLVPGPGAGHPLLDGTQWLVHSDESLITRLELLNQVLQQASILDCAAIARGSLADERLDALIQKLSPTWQDRWKRMSAELSSPPIAARIVDARNYRAFLDAMGTELKGSGIDFDAYDRPYAATDDVACKAHRLFVSAALRLPSELASVGAIVSAGGEVSEEGHSSI